MSMFCFDIESCDIDSTTVILSAALLHIDPENLPSDNNDAYTKMVTDAMFVKFKVSEQVKAGRTMSKDTLDWWAKQGQAQKEKSFIPSTDDLTVQEAYDRLSDYFFSVPGAKNMPIWVRGSMDQPAFESLCRVFKLKPITPFNNYRDIRTAISILYCDTEKAGYVEVPNFNRDLVIKHQPEHDVALDMLMLLRGKQA